MPPPHPEDLEEVRRQIRRRLREKPDDGARGGLRARGSGKNPSPHPAGAGLGPSAETVTYSRTIPRGPFPRATAVNGRPAATLEEAVRGHEIEAPLGGRAYLAPTRLAELDQRWATVESNLSHALERPSSGLSAHLRLLGFDSGLAPEEFLFLDLETTGLSSSPLFLVGTLQWTDSGLEVRQYLARDYTEEAAVVSLFTEEAQSRQVLVSFNGKSFDLPYLRMRAATLRVPLRHPEAHLDLLHVARRLWRGRLPDCRLQTLERHLCGRIREDDLPGSEIPQAYHDFVRTGDASLMAEILRHNLLDLATLAELLTRLPD